MKHPASPMNLPAKLPVKRPPTLLWTPEDEQRAIADVADLAEMVRHRFQKEHGREFLETETCHGLREGELQFTHRTIQAAYAGSVIADAALRKVCSEIMSGAFREWRPGYQPILSYGQHLLLRTSHEQRRGPSGHDNLVRDVNICLLIVCACHQQSVHPTRTQNRRPGRCTNRAPSGVSLVVAALELNKMDYLTEKSVQDNIWFGLPGDVVRRISDAQSMVL